MPHSNTLSLFVAGIKTKIGYEKRTTKQKVMDGFRKQGIILSDEDVVRLVMQTVSRALVKGLIYDGSDIYITDDTTALNHYINRLMTWRNGVDREYLQRDLMTLAEGANNYVIELKK